MISLLSGGALFNRRCRVSKRICAGLAAIIPNVEPAGINFGHAFVATRAELSLGRFALTSCAHLQGGNVFGEIPPGHNEGSNSVNDLLSQERKHNVHFDSLIVDVGGLGRSYSFGRVIFLFSTNAQLKSIGGAA